MKWFHSYKKQKQTALTKQLFLFTNFWNKEVRAAGYKECVKKKMCSYLAIRRTKKADTVSA